jgi:hypothetical protein
MIGWSLDQCAIHLEHTVKVVVLVAGHEIVALVRAKELEALQLT